MSDKLVGGVTTLTFDIFGTVLDLTAGMVPGIANYLKVKEVPLDPAIFWAEWRSRQRIEQYQDTLLMLGHSGYLETARRALRYTLRLHRIRANAADIERLMRGFEYLNPYKDAVAGLFRLAEKYRLVALSNGNDWLVDQLVATHIKAPFETVISVDRFGAFKPHPAVYRGAAKLLRAEPSEILMVAAHSFDIVGARVCGFRGAYVNRYQLPYESSQPLPDIEVEDFLQLADELLDEQPVQPTAAAAVQG